MERLVVIGPGRVGLALGYALSQADAVESLEYQGRRPEPPSHPLFVQGLADYRFGVAVPAAGTLGVVLAVPDPVLPELAHALAAQGPPPAGCVAIHTSGALSAEVLAPLHAVGYSVGSLHPLLSIAHPVTGAERLRGAGFAVSGEPGAGALARRLVLALDGEILEIPVGSRALYHAASVLVSDGLAAVLGVAEALVDRAGADPGRVRRALVHAGRSALDDLGDLGWDGGVTGPVPRGDLEMVDLHLRALDGEHREVYRALSRTLVDVAERRGLPSDTVEEMRELLEPSSGRAVEEST